MKKIAVLGGCGAVGRVAVRTLARRSEFERVVIADMDMETGKQLESEIGTDKVEFIRMDATDIQQVKNIVSKADLVANCIGPFYKTVKPIVSAVIEAKKDYIDVCDDVDVTLDLLEMNDKAVNAGISVVIGMGSSPGATNLLARFAAEQLLDETDSVDIFHAHGGEPIEGEGVIGHRFHCMRIPIPMFLDGELMYVGYFEKEGIALRTTFDFPVLGKGIKVYPYPHPEQVTIPRYIKVRQVTNRGTVLPDEYYQLIMDICRIGLDTKEPLKVKGQEVIPYDFAISFIKKEREIILEKSGFGTQKGCCSVVVRGKKDGRPLEYRFHMASASEALGEGTGIPLAMGAMLMAEGKITEKGVLPPEACINPLDFIRLIDKVIPVQKDENDDNRFAGLIVEKVDESGEIETISL